MKAKLLYRRKILFLFFVFVIGVVMYFGNAINALFLSPFTKIGYTVADVFDVMLNGLRRTEEIRQLRIKNLIFEAERVLDENIKRENEELRAVLGRTHKETKLV